MTDPAAPAAATDWTRDVADAVVRDRHGPYGLIGLTISTIAILVATLVLTMLAAVATFVAVGLVIGWHPALDRFADLRAAAGSGEAFLQRIGVAVSLVVYAALSLSIVAAARWRGRGWWRELIGWRRWHPFRASRLYWIVVAGTVVYGTLAALLIARLYPASKDWVTLPPERLWAGLFILLAVAAAPVAEELFFRGWIYTALRRRIGIWAAIIVSAVLFAIAHWEKTHIYALAVFPVGVALGFLRERTGSLKASMTCHATYNAAASLLLVLGF